MSGYGSEFSNVLISFQNKNKKVKGIKENKRNSIKNENVILFDMTENGRKEIYIVSY